ncbi:AAA family ATPase [Anaerosporobacter sp.]|uniref:AAA family ATPase n=1 Tax=Anaerosporobacter sp. TaxID=1872529 RepID=UPI00286F1C26|nr:AAA family ATPase [Anaerosporobacter sp.]
MGMFLNSNVPYTSYKAVFLNKYFVDKSLLMKDLFPVLGGINKYICITRPRRFGKSVMANMIGAFFGKTQDAYDVFDKLVIAKMKGYEEHLNQHNVIYIDFSRVPENCNTYQNYINRISRGIKEDILQTYSELNIDKNMSIWDILLVVFQKTTHRFVFVMDEWDAVFHMSYISSEEQKEYLLFLKNLLKDQVYVELAYMTGVLPIAKYSSGSELNMFLEYDMATKKKFSEYFGFLDREVDTLYEVYKKETESPEISRGDLRVWYDGYYTAMGERMYNPRSVVCALSDNELADYWTSSGPYDEIFYYVRNNIEEVREDLVLMIAGEGIETEIQNYAAASMNLNTKEEIYSAMLVYGLLTYEERKVFIPNREIMDQFKKLLMSKESFGYVYRLAKESEKMLKATLSSDTKTMTEILKFAHDTESPIFSYNSEIELSAVVNLVYLAARDRYRVEREDKAGEGYVDFIFYPERKGADALILELKIDCSPDEAIQQIKDKNYDFRFRGKLGERKKYTGRVFAVGISYNRKTKEHFCKVEELSGI